MTRINADTKLLHPRSSASSTASRDNAARHLTERSMPRLLWMLLLSGIALACGDPVGNPLRQQSSDPGDSIVFGPPAQVDLLDPYQGRWKFDFERTMAVWKSQGVPEERIEAARQFTEQLRTTEIPPHLKRALKLQDIDPEAWWEERARLHPDFRLDGHVATGESLSRAEYRFFGLHEHDGVLCGKAWHHEDRFDPGDMSKCYVNLRRTGDELHLDVFFVEESVDLNDPDLVGSPQLTLGPGEQCTAPAEDRTDLMAWTTYVFVRPSVTNRE